MPARALPDSSPRTNRPTRVLLISQALTQGGSERQLAATAMSLDRTRFAVQVAVMRPGGFRAEELVRAGVPVTVFPVTSFRKKFPAQAWNLWRFLRRERFDVLHCFDTPSAIFSIAVARLARVPVVLTSQRCHRELLSAWECRAMRLFDRIATGVVVNCSFLADHLVRQEHVPAAKVHLCYNGLDTAQFHPHGPRAPLPFPPGSTVIGSVCALRPEKDLAVLMEAFAGLAPRWSQARLILVGDGPERPRLEAMARERGISHLVHFQPSVSGTAPWFRSLDIFVLPSRSEAFSNSIMEAMACGVVPVVSSSGGNTELVRAGRGLVFDIGDTAALAAHLETLLKDSHLRASLGRAASDWVISTLPLDRMAEAMGGIYLAVSPSGRAG